LYSIRNITLYSFIFFVIAKYAEGIGLLMSQWCKDNNRLHVIHIVINYDSLIFGNWTTPFFSWCVLWRQMNE